MMVSYDPGAKAAGIALWEGGELCGAFLARGQRWLDTAQVAVIQLAAHLPDLSMVQEIATEIPQVYTQHKLKGDPNDLITLAMNVGAFVAAFGAEVTEYRPHEWKKQVPKEILTKRTQARLSIEELSRIDKAPKSLMHNVYDAVGIGLHHLKRK